MQPIDSPRPGHFCWLDLAATDAARAQDFYARVFGWQARDQAANGGHFTRLRLGARDIGSLYQLSAAQRDRQVPSHWTAYIAVPDLDETLLRVTQAGGRVIVPPVIVEGMARIALIEDAVGAWVGLWQGQPENAAPQSKTPTIGPAFDYS